MSTTSHLSDALADRYTIGRELGRGGMATVYLAHDIKHDREVALKVLDPELGAVMGAKRFLSEIRVTANLQHPNILPLFDSGEVDGVLYYVMPFVDGESLGARLTREQQLPIDEAIRIAAAVASALDYAHRRHVVHRDLKPDNILLIDGQPVVADFGIALAVSNAAGGRITGTGLSVGTPQYMSPEQAAGERSVDGRSDIYALGAVTYEMLVGEPPHTGHSARAIIAKIMTERPRAVRLTRDRVPVRVEQAVERALAKLPADRFATAQGFADALLERGVAEPPSWQMVRSRWRSRTALAAAFTLATTVAAFVADGRARGRDAARVPRFFTVTLPDSAPMVPGRDFQDVSARALAISRDGTALVYSARDSAGTHLMLARLDLGTITPVRNTESATIPAFSPDGRSIVFESHGALRRLSLNDASVTSLGELDWTTDLLWDTSGSIYRSSISCLWSVPATGGPMRRASKETCTAGQLAPIANSDWMLSTSFFAIVAFSRTTGELRAIRSSHASTSATVDPPLAGATPFMVSPGVLAFVRDSSIYAARFDESRLQILSEPQVMLTGVRSEFVGQHVALANDGTLVWVSGGDGTRAKFVWVTPDGRRRDSLFLARTPVSSYALSAAGDRVAYASTSSLGAPRLLVASLDRKVVAEVKTSVLLQPLNWIAGDRKLVVGVLYPSRLLETGVRTAAPPPDARVAAMRRTAVISWLQGAPVVDTSEAPFEDESRDGSHRCLSFGTPSGGVELWPTTTPSRRISLQAGPGSWCRFSPDGRRLAWVTPDGSLYVAQADSTGPRTRVRVAENGADEPRWSADGRQVVYRSAHAWYVTDAPLARSSTSSPPRRLFDGHFLQAYSSWAIAPDGRYLLLAGLDQTPARSINVLTNFPTFVEQRLRSSK